MNNTRTSISPLRWLLFWAGTPNNNTHIRRQSQRCCITGSFSQDGRGSRMARTQRYFHFTLKRLWHPITSPKMENKPYARTCEAIKKVKYIYIHFFFFFLEKGPPHVGCNLHLTVKTEQQRNTCRCEEVTLKERLWLQTPQTGQEVLLFYSHYFQMANCREERKCSGAQSKYLLVGTCQQNANGNCNVDCVPCCTNFGLLWLH